MENMFEYFESEQEANIAKSPYRNTNYTPRPTKTYKQEKADKSYTIELKETIRNRYKILTSPYHRDIWNYLQLNIIRGDGGGNIWGACHDIYKQYGLLSCSVSVKKMSETLNIGITKCKEILKELDNYNYIIKFRSKKNNKNNNPNIYIMGIISNTKFVKERYFLDADKEPVTKKMRGYITSLFSKQLGIVDEIKEISNAIEQIEKILFKPIIVPDEEEGEEGQSMPTTNLSRVTTYP